MKVSSFLLHGLFNVVFEVYADNGKISDKEIEGILEVLKQYSMPIPLGYIIEIPDHKYVLSGVTIGYRSSRYMLNRIGE